MRRIHLRTSKTWITNLKSSQNMLWSNRAFLLFAADLIWFRWDQVDEFCKTLNKTHMFPLQNNTESILVQEPYSIYWIHVGEPEISMPIKLETSSQINVNYLLPLHHLLVYWSQENFSGHHELWHKKGPPKNLRMPWLLLLRYALYIHTNKLTREVQKIDSKKTYPHNTRPTNPVHPWPLVHLVATFPWWSWS